MNVSVSVLGFEACSTEFSQDNELYHPVLLAECPPNCQENIAADSKQPFSEPDLQNSRYFWYHSQVNAPESPIARSVLSANIDLELGKLVFPTNVNPKKIAFFGLYFVFQHD